MKLRADWVMVVLTTTAALVVTGVITSNKKRGEVIDQEEGHFFWFTDAHYDRYYGTPKAQVHNGAPCNSTESPSLSTYGCGSSKALLKSAFAAASNVINRPDFILFTGDATRHGSKKTPNATFTVLDAFATIPKLLEESFPNLPVIHLPSPLGNNDVDGNYNLEYFSAEPCFPGPHMPPANPFLSKIVSYSRRQFINDEEASIFACGGYLSRKIRPGLYIIALNTVVWSTHHTSTVKGSEEDDPFGQFTWLRAELTNIRNRQSKAYLTGHIPPVIDSYRTIIGTQFLQSVHQSRYLDILAQFPDVIAGQFFGHIHSNELRAVPVFDDDMPPLISLGSISPCYGNTPFFSLVKYHVGTKFPKDVVTYQAMLGEFPVRWRSMFDSLVEFLGMMSLTNKETRILAGRMFSSNPDHPYQDTIVAKERVFANTQDMFSKYYYYWYKGRKLEETDGCQDDYDCRRGQSCLLACGFDSDMWRSCLEEEDENAQCSI